MKILFLSDNFPPEGNAIASRVFERARYWAKWGHEVTIITSTPNFPEGKIYPGYKNHWYHVERVENIRVVRVKTFIAKNKGTFFRTLDFLSYLFPALFAGLVQEKPDIIAATTPQFFVGITGWLLSVLRRKPFILEVADIWPASIVSVGAMKKNWLIAGLEKIELFLYRRAKAIIVLTHAFKTNLVSRHIPAKKISVILNGVELSQYTPQTYDSQLAQEYEIDPNAFVVGYLGTHGMAHGLKNVLRAAEQLQQSTIQFLFVGAGAERHELMQYAAERQLTNVKFIPAQPKHSMPRFWSLCHVALVHLKNDPVFSEVIPSKIFEAMGMGLPILLAAPAGEASNLVTTEGVGIWVPAEDAKALAESIMFYQKDAEQRTQIAKISQQRASAHSREYQAQAVLAVFAANKGDA